MKIYPIFAIQRYEGQHDFRFFGYSENEETARKFVDYLVRSYEEAGYMNDRGEGSLITENVLYIDRDVSVSSVRAGRVGLEWHRRGEKDGSDIHVIDPFPLYTLGVKIIHELDINFDRLGDNLVYTADFDRFFGGVNLNIAINPLTQLDSSGIPYRGDVIFAKNFDEAREKAFNEEFVLR